MRDRGVEACRVHIERVFQHIDEHRRGADQRHHLGRSGEGEGGHEHRVARADVPRAQDEHQRIGAVGAGDGVLHAGERGQLLFKLPDLRTQNPLPAFDGGGDGTVDFAGDAAALGLKIDEGNGPNSILLHAGWLC